VKHLFCLSLLIIAKIANSDSALHLKGENITSTRGTFASPIIFKPNSTYISRNAYTQNPYMLFPSKGGTQNISESEYDRHSVARKWFADGTWNVAGVASYAGINGDTNIGYGANIFGQTGYVAGFAFGGLLTVMNPAPLDGLNTNGVNSAQTLPVSRQITPQELFVEYQYSNIVQIDAGWIGIHENPWLTYDYQGSFLNFMTYQGAIANVHPGGGWLLTALAFNAVQMVSANGFSNLTAYNPEFDRGTRTQNVADQTSAGTISLGASWASPADLVDFQVWGYKFYNYAQMLYADSNVNLKVNDNLGFTISTQAAYQQSPETNILNSNGYGNNVRSNMVGLQLAMNYAWFGLELGYNNIWGQDDSYEGGGLVSPYTYQYSTDPLYTTSWLQGMVEKSAGQAYKIATPLTFLDTNLAIYPGITYYATTNIPSSYECDLIFNYSIPQVKGFDLYAVYAYLSQAEALGGNLQQIQLALRYLY
jgi:hypothetical protein